MITDWIPSGGVTVLDVLVGLLAIVVLGCTVGGVIIWVFYM